MVNKGPDSHEISVNLQESINLRYDRDVRLVDGDRHRFIWTIYLLISFVLLSGSFTIGFLVAHASSSTNALYPIAVVILILFLICIFVVLIFRCRRARREGDVTRNGYPDEWEH